jgi:hypothetical protein
MSTLKKTIGAIFLLTLVLAVFLIHEGRAESACVNGGGHVINNVGEFRIDGCVVDPVTKVATGNIYFEGHVVHSGSQNSLVNKIIIFNGTINSLTIAGPYAGYEGSGNLTLCDEGYMNCAGYAATLFPPGSNVKDTARERGGVVRGFDDINISIVYGENLFVTANGFIEYCYDQSGNVSTDCITVSP